MLSAKLLVGEIVTSLRQVIGPAISEPYPKGQAYMAATILEFVARQIEERGGSDSKKEAVLEALFDDIGKLGLPAGIASAGSREAAALSDLISNLYQARSVIGEDAFAAANLRVRRALRDLLNFDLEIAGKEGE